MPLARLFDRVVLLILGRHDLVQVDLVVQVIVVLETSERLQHLLDLPAQVLYQCLVLDAQALFSQAISLLLHPGLLLLHDRLKDGALVVLRLDLPCLQVDDLPQLVH